MTKPMAGGGLARVTNARYLDVVMLNLLQHLY
jgi:hypothetical protein